MVPFGDIEEEKKEHDSSDEEEAKSPKKFNAKKNQSVAQEFLGIKMESEKRRKEEARSEGHNSDAEDYEDKILKAINDEEKKLDDDDELSSLPSETDEGFVAATVKSKQVNTNQIAKVDNPSK